MYRAYKVIAGVMHIQSMPRGPWRKMTAEELTQRILELEAERRPIVF